METRPTVLVVEDDDDVRLGLRVQLESHGFDVQLASEGIGAIQRLVEHPQISIILSDLRMPIFGGDYWLKFLTRFCVPRYRVIIQTGCPLPDISKEVQVILKPYPFSALLKLLEDRE